MLIKIKIDIILYNILEYAMYKNNIVQPSVGSGPNGSFHVMSRHIEHQSHPGLSHTQARPKPKPFSSLPLSTLPKFRPHFDSSPAPRRPDVNQVQVPFQFPVVAIEVQVEIEDPKQTRFKILGRNNLIKFEWYGSRGPCGWSNEQKGYMSVWYTS